MIPADHTTSPQKRRWQTLFGYLFALACLVWVFHDLHPRAILHSISGMSWRWIPLAVFFDILSYYSQGLRWSYLLHPLGRISALESTRAIYAGLFTNEILPLRAGELVRLWLVARRLEVRFATVIPSVVVERFFDGIWLALFVGLAALFVPLPKTLLHAEEVLGVIVLAVTGLVLYLVLRREGLSEADAGSGRGVYRRLPRALAGGWARLARGIREIGLSRRFFLSLAVSALILIFQIIAFWLVMRAYSLPLSLWAGAVVLLIVHFGTAIPNAPSNVGSYQFFTVVALSLYGVDKTAATGFSIAVFFILTIPLWIIGLWAIGSTGMSLAAIRREIAALHATPSGGARP